MNFEQQINDQIKQAMLGKKEAALRALRAIKSAILLAKTSEGAGDEISKDDEIKMLQKLIKSRKDSLEIFTTQNRPELAAKEQEEIEVIEQFLPKQMSEEELKAAIQNLITEMGVTNPAEMGKVIGAANKSLAGKAEGKAISLMVKNLLNN
jgi:uncharacterized protein